MTVQSNYELAAANRTVTLHISLAEFGLIISRHFHPEQLQTGVFHGSDRRKISSDSIFAKDIIITTYETLKSEWCGDRSNSLLFSETQKWSRVVLDEGWYPFFPCPIVK